MCKGMFTSGGQHTSNSHKKKKSHMKKVHIIIQNSYYSKLLIIGGQNFNLKLKFHLFHLCLTQIKVSLVC